MCIKEICTSRAIDKIKEDSIVYDEAKRLKGF